jgi:hypothetical protein
MAGFKVITEVISILKMQDDWIGESRSLELRQPLSDGPSAHRSSLFMTASSRSRRVVMS